MKDSRYFTPAELAKLFGISKQLLLYYDKNDIFSPEFVDENGYRFYVLSQYFTLQIIISLRKLDVSLKEIKAYLKSKDINLLKNIYRNKQQEYKKQIEELLYLEKTMQQKISFLNNIANLPLNQILLEIQEEKCLYFSEAISIKKPIKQRMNTLAKHMLPVFSHESFQEYLMGFHYDSKEYFYEDRITQYNVFISANSKLNYKNPIKFIKEKGLYLCVYCNAQYGVVDNKIKERIRKFIKQNNLSFHGGIYLFPLRNFWSTSKPKEELVKLCLRVEYTD